MADPIIYKPPFATIVGKDTVFELDGCSGFLIENLGTTAFNCGEPGLEIVPFESGDSREFEAPDGGLYLGSYAIKFIGGTGKAMVIRNSPVGGFSNSVKLAQNVENYKEKVI